MFLEKDKKTCHFKTMSRKWLFSAEFLPLDSQYVHFVNNLLAATVLKQSEL